MSLCMCHGEGCDKIHSENPLGFRTIWAKRILSVGYQSIWSMLLIFPLIMSGSQDRQLLLPRGAQGEAVEVPEQEDQEELWQENQGRIARLRFFQPPFFSSRRKEIFLGRLMKVCIRSSRVNLSYFSMPAGRLLLIVSLVSEGGLQRPRSTRLPRCNSCQSMRRKDSRRLRWKF